MKYSELLQTVATRYKDASIKEEDIPFVKGILNKENVVSILEDILNQPELLKKIANRSHTNALGFNEIILIDLVKDVDQLYQRTNVILNIKSPSDDLPISDMVHEQIFDSVSVVLGGYLENQQFRSNPMTPDMQDLLTKLINVIPTLFFEDLNSVNEQIEIIDAIKLQGLGSEQLTKMKLHQKYDLYKIMGLTGMTTEEVFKLNQIQGHYFRHRSLKENEKELYKYLLFSADKVLKLKEGDSYFQPYNLPHRLYSDHKLLNSFISVTTPATCFLSGGFLQRPTQAHLDEKVDDKTSLTYEGLKGTIVDYLEHLKAN